MQNNTLQNTIVIIKLQLAQVLRQQPNSAGNGVIDSVKNSILKMSKVTLSTTWWYVWQNFEEVLPLTLNLRSAVNVAQSKYSIQIWSSQTPYGCSVCVPPLQINPGKRTGNQIGWNFAVSVYKPKHCASRHRYLSPSWFPRGLQFNRHLRELKQPIMGLLSLTRNPTWHWITCKDGSCQCCISQVKLVSLLFNVTTSPPWPKWIFIGENVYDILVKMVKKVRILLICWLYGSYCPCENKSF